MLKILITFLGRRTETNIQIVFPQSTTGSTLKKQNKNTVQSGKI